MFLDAFTSTHMKYLVLKYKPSWMLLNNEPKAIPHQYVLLLPFLLGNGKKIYICSYRENNSR